MRKLLGYQIADADGTNIQGDDGDPSGLPSFHIMTAQEAAPILEASPSRLLLMPIFEGDIENPSFG